MPHLTHPNWYEKEGVCVKHGIPQVPCPRCLAEQDPGIQVMLTEADRAQIDWDPNFKATDMFSANQAWLAERII